MINKEVVRELYKQGYSYQEIAEELAVSRQRIHQIVKDYYNTGRQNRLGKYRDFGLCTQCGVNQAQVLHHIDKNNSNDDITNLEALCQNCHLTIHSGQKRNNQRVTKRMVKTVQKKELYTLKEVADLLRVDRVSVWRYVRDGKIKAVKIGKTLRIPVREIEYLFPKNTFLYRLEKAKDYIAFGIKEGVLSPEQFENMTNEELVEFCEKEIE